VRIFIAIWAQIPKLRNRDAMKTTPLKVRNDSWQRRCCERRRITHL